MRTTSVLRVPPAANASVEPVRVKSPARRGSSGAAVTVSVTGTANPCSAVADTRATPPASPIVSADNSTVTVGSSSSSPISSVRAAGPVTVRAFAAVPLTVSVRVGP